MSLPFSFPTPLGNTQGMVILFLYFLQTIWWYFPAACLYFPQVISCPLVQSASPSPPSNVALLLQPFYRDAPACSALPHANRSTLWVNCASPSPGSCVPQCVPSLATTSTLSLPTLLVLFCSCRPNLCSVPPLKMLLKTHKDSLLGLPLKDTGNTRASEKGTRMFELLCLNDYG